MSHYDMRISELNQKYEEAVEQNNRISAEAEDFLIKNPKKNLSQELKKKLETSNTELQETQKQLEYMTSMRQWLVDNFPEGKYRDVVGLCKAATIEEIREQDYSLNPGRYVGVSFDIEDKNDFKEAMQALSEELTILNFEGQKLMKQILDKLSLLGI